MTALLCIDLLGTKARWRRGGSNAAVALWEDFADLVTDTASSMDVADQIFGNIDGDTCALRCPSVETALALGRRVFRRAWLETRTPDDMRLWLRGLVTTTDNGGGAAKGADPKKAAKKKSPEKADGKADGKAADKADDQTKDKAAEAKAKAKAKAPATPPSPSMQGGGLCLTRPDDEIPTVHRKVPIPSIQNAYVALRSGYRGMRILVDENLLNDQLRGMFRIPLGRLGVIPFRRMNYTPYPPNLKRSFQDFLWMADSATEWAQSSLRMKQRMLWSADDHAEFVQASATQVVFHETDAILQSVTRKNQLRSGERSGSNGGERQAGAEG